ncbi:MAG: glycoside hydrolase family 52 protein [Phycisphaerae bacterium]
MTVQLKPLSGNISFNAQHSPMGAFMSFTCGNFGTRGGIAAQIGRPANQDLYIGIKEGGRFDEGTLRCLPFFARAAGGGAGAADYLVEQAGPAEQNVAARVKAYGREQIERRYGWATDAWATRDFSFTLFTPFGEIPDPTTATPSEMRDALLPAVVAELAVDNRNGSRAITAFFAVNFNEPGWRPVDSGNPLRRGFALRRDYGVLGEVLGDDSQAAEAPALFCRWSPDQGVAERVPHLLGSCPGLLMEVPPGERRVLRLSIGCYIAGVVTTDLEGRYLYTNHFGSLEDVLNAALMKGDPRHAAETLDQRLLDSGLSNDQQFLIAHATRSYYGSTQLLDVGGQPFWVVNEGEYCMMNTLDLCVDHMFWEIEQNAWVVRNLLDHFVRYYSYVDGLKVGTSGKTMEGGLSFTHDMGAHNNFSPRGQSSYELPDLNAVCFSYMTAEQLCNWVLMAATYVAKTGDVNWARQNSYVLLGCLESLCNRGGESAIPEYDSTRCGSGAEITTYDSLDHSLAQTRNSLYMGVKFWASFVGLAMMFERLGEPWQPTQTQALRKAEQAVRTLVRQAGPDGVVPAVFEKDSNGYRSRILPACEGLIYPAAWGMDVAQEFPDLFNCLKRHTIALLTDGERRNLFADGGIKLSSTSSNSWMSKIAIFQEIARHVFRLSDHAAILAIFERADSAHVKWQTDGSSYWACSDQFVEGVAKGSRWYPRVITTALWMDHSGKHEPRGKEAALAGGPKTKG